MACITAGGWLALGGLGLERNARVFAGGAGLAGNERLYFVVGIFETWQDHPLETIVKVGAGTENNNFSKDLLAGCGKGRRHAHINGPESDRYLVAFFQDWETGDLFENEREEWIMKNLNRGHLQPATESYSWNMYRITFAIKLPVLLSIIAGVT
ncbi:hypothetical protein B0T14DRAFT_565304 [Immersiella caudata]|uniref:Uncharacterized protein n=1 Tax=Immersiella caudata TaxID=314043 RepID=A0AA39WZ36_9PEZI|nr:hypothetical protein B0T14DRAFT_565304 [Immersiella caudata]